MTTDVSDYPSVATRMSELGCVYPDAGLALLPLNFESAVSADDLRLSLESSTVKTLFRRHGVPLLEIRDASKKPPFVSNNAFDWVAPTLFVSAGLLSQNSHLVSVALNVLSSYATDFLKGNRSANRVRLEVVVEKMDSKVCKRISYEGPPEGIRDLADLVRETSRE